MTKEEFATKIKAKYPEYQAVDTNTLVSKIVEKYPVYQGQISDYTVAPKSNVFTRVGDELSKRSENIAETVNTVGTDTPVLKTSLDVANQVVGAPIAAAYEALPQGVQNVGDKVGAAFGNTISSITDYISDIPKLQKFIMENPDKAKQLEDVFGAVASGSELVGNATALVGAPGAVQRTVNTTRNAANTVAGATRNAVNQTFQAGKKVLPKSENIMNKVARLTPTQARKFEQLTGKTHGQYLTETGNFGTPDEIVRRESEKFAQSLKSVDDTLSQLDGEFTDGIIDDVLNELQEKAVATSTKNVKSPYLDRVNELMAKNTESGLSMSEINELKRLYERNVKLGYNKLVDAEKIQRATNLDNALREWQILKAEELGFENLRDLNKQTQASKQLINSLGDQLIGQTGLNDVTLTDWIMLSGGDPTAVGGLLTKKFFSSKKVQSKIAEWLNDTEVTPIIKPKVGGNYIDQASTATTTTNTTKNNIPTTVPEPTTTVKRPAKNIFSGSSPGFANIGGEMKDVTRYVDKANPYSGAAALLDEMDRKPLYILADAISTKGTITKQMIQDADRVIEKINESMGKKLINPDGTDLSKLKQITLLREADDALTSKAISAYDKAQAKLGNKANKKK